MPLRLPAGLLGTAVQRKFLLIIRFRPRSPNAHVKL
jgi:hypothetical protein